MSKLNNIVKISVRVQPRAVKNVVVSFTNDVWQIRLIAPPVKGKANQELVDFLSQILGIAKSSVSIIKGHTNKNKLLAINGLSQKDIIRRFTQSGKIRPLSSYNDITGKRHLQFPK
ncbi:DUF167 domain-containing protein [Chloroflexota bacterium]